MPFILPACTPGSEPDHSPGLQGYCTRITLFVEAVNWFLAREVWVSWRRWQWRSLYSRMWGRIVWNIRTDVLYESPASSLRVDSYYTALKMEAAEFSETSTRAIWLKGIITLKTAVFWFLAYLRMCRLYRPTEIGFSDVEEYHKRWAVNEMEWIVLGVLEMVIPEFSCTIWEKLRNERDYLSSRFVYFIPGVAAPQWSNYGARKNHIISPMLLQHADNLACALLCLEAANRKNWNLIFF